MKAKTLMILGSVMIVASQFMRVGTMFSESFNGYESDLMFSGVIGGLLLLIGILRKGTPGKRYAPWATILASISIILVLIIYLRSLGIFFLVRVGGMTHFKDDVSFGMALPVCGLGSVLTFIASLKTVVSDSQPVTSSAPTNLP